MTFLSREMLTALAAGNPGAFTFIIKAIENCPLRGDLGLARMLDHDIRGDKLYILWNDCCNRDTEKTVRVMNLVRIDTIIEHINYGNGRGIPFESSTPSEPRPMSDEIFECFRQS